MRRAALSLLLLAVACSGTGEATTAAVITVPEPTTTMAGEGVSVHTVAPELDAATGGIAVDGEGNIYVANIGPAPRRRGTRVLRITPGGEVEVFAEDDRLRGAAGNVVAPDGTLYQSAFTAGAVLRISPDGTVEDYADDGVAGPMGIVVDPGGDGIYLADCTADTVVRVDAGGDASDFADDPQLDCPTGLAMDDDGNLYAANFSDGRVLKIDSTGSVSDFAVVPGDNNAHLVFNGELLYLVGRGAHQIFTVTLDGQVDVLAGTGERGLQDGPGSAATFSLPNGIALGPDGALYINQVVDDTGNRNFPVAVRRITINE